MKPREIFLAALHRQAVPRAAAGSATSVVTTDLMDQAGVWFPEAHLDARKMAALAETAVTVLGFDNIMPLFSVWHESAALGCEVDWGDRNHMPTGKPCCSSLDAELVIPRDFLLRPSRSAITLADAAGCGALPITKPPFVKPSAWRGSLPPVTPWPTAMSGREVASFARCLGLLRTIGDPPELACARYAEAVGVLGQRQPAVSRCAVLFYFTWNRTRRTLPQITLAEAAAEMIELRRQAKASGPYLTDLRCRIGPSTRAFPVHPASVTTADCQRYLDGL